MRQTAVTRAIGDVLAASPVEAFWAEDASHSSVGFVGSGPRWYVSIRTDPEYFPTPGHVWRQLAQCGGQAATLWALLVDCADDSGTGRVDLYDIALRLWPGCKIVLHSGAGYEAVWAMIEFLSQVRIVDLSRAGQRTERPLLVILSALRSRDTLPPALVTYRVAADDRRVVSRREGVRPE